MKTISFFLFCCTAICLSGEIFSPIPLGSLAKSKKTFVYPKQSQVIEPKGEKDYYLGFRISPRIGSLGIGLEMAQGIRPNFGTRFGYSVFTWEKNGERSGNDYDLDFTLSNFAIITDWHFNRTPLRLSGGIIFNANGIDGNALNRGSFELNGVSYDSNEITGMNLDVTHNAVAPYIGLGWDSTFGKDKNWGFVVDVGLIYTGSPEVALDIRYLSFRPPLSKRLEIEKNAQIEEGELKEELDAFRLWPVVSAGLSYQF